MKGRDNSPEEGKVGDVYRWSVCDLAVTVNEVCGSVDAYDIVCCEKQMKPEKRA